MGKELVLNGFGQRVEFRIESVVKLNGPFHSSNYVSECIMLSTT